MKFFLDTAEIDEIRAFAATGLVDGVTTNPSLIKKSGRIFKDVLREISEVVDGPVSAEVTATEFTAMVREAHSLREVAPNICIKVPLTIDGMRACKMLADEGTRVNVTLCFSANQALVAAKAGAAYISPFVGRVDDVGGDGMQLIADIRRIYDNYKFETKILVASVRSPSHVCEAAKIGADVVTAPMPVLQALFKHPLTDRGVETFAADWRATGQQIL